MKRSADGKEFTPLTLDTPSAFVQTKPGEVIKHGAIKMIEEEGFPTYKDPFNKGRLIVVFNVQFPESLPAEASRKIASALHYTLPKTTSSKDKGQNQK